jgi:hypothetical protein
LVEEVRVMEVALVLELKLAFLVDRMVLGSVDLAALVALMALVALGSVDLAALVALMALVAFEEVGRIGGLGGLMEDLMEKVWLGA